MQSQDRRILGPRHTPGSQRFSRFIPDLETALHQDNPESYSVTSTSRKVKRLRLSASLRKCFQPNRNLPNYISIVCKPCMFACQTQYSGCFCHEPILIHQHSTPSLFFLQPASCFRLLVWVLTLSTVIKSD